MAEGESGMNEHEEQLDKQLERLGEALRSQPSMIEQGMFALEKSPPAGSRRSLVLLPSRTRSGLGLAACVLIAVTLWLWLAGPGNLTLADVQKSIDAKPWVLIQYDDGLQEWANLRERLSFLTYRNPLNFYVGMRDHGKGLWRAYHSNWGQQIHEEPFTPRPYPQTPWEYAVGGWDGQGIGESSHTLVEKSKDTIDGKEMVRFDTYDLGPCGLRALAQQVWADPETRLPLRIRKYPNPQSPHGTRKVKTGDFSFPEAGPASIHDLGAPQGLPVVTNWGIIEPAAKAVVDAGKQAYHGLPRNLRVVMASEYGLFIGYRCGDWFREESYGRTNADHSNPLPVELPGNLEQIRDWASSHLSLVHLRVFDGQYEYDHETGEGLWRSSEERHATLHVQRTGADWIDDVLVPLRDQWPYMYNVGPMTVLENEPETPPGCVLLRYEGTNLRRDWYVDPARDYICVKQFEFSRKEATGPWLESRRRIERTNLARLPSGQWYARTVRVPAVPNAWQEFHVTLLSEAEVERLVDKAASANAFFSGEKVLKEATAKGAKVTFWAR
jgi:hypothetical protein